MNVFDSALPAKYFLSRLDRNVEGVESHLDSVAKDIVDAIAEKSRYLSWEISDHIREVVASNEALQQEFGDKFDAAHERLILELGDIGESLEDVRVDLDHGFSLVTEQLELQNSTLIEIAKHLDNLYEITLNQEGTKARRLFLRGCELWDKGLLPEALDSLNKAATTYSADSITHFQLGKLYLNGKNKSDDVVDLEQAETHLKLAARYGEAEIKHEPKMAKFTGAALFLLSEACYRQGVESKDGRFKEISYRKAFEAAKKSISMYKDIPVNRYHLATVSALLGETVQAITSLRRAIKADRQFCLMVDKDKGFDAIRAKVKKLLSRLRDAARRGADSRLRTVGAELGNRKFVGAEELSLEKEIRTLITKAE